MDYFVFLPNHQFLRRLKLIYAMVSLEMAPLTAGVTTDSAYAPVIVQTASQRPLWITTIKMAVFYALCRS